MINTKRTDAPATARRTAAARAETPKRTAAPTTPPVPVTGRRQLSENIFALNDTRKTGLNNNDLVIGSSGAGKTGGYVIPNIAGTDYSFICADTKCSLAKKLTPMLKSKGYKVYTIDFVSPENSTVYNPLDYISCDPETGEYRQQDILTIANTLIPDSLDKDDLFWVINARIVIQSLISYVLESFAPQHRNLAGVIETYKAFSATEPRSIIENGIPFFEEWALEHPDSEAVKAYRLFRGNAGAEKMWSSINGFVMSAIQCFDLKEAKQMFNGKPTFRIEDLGREKVALFLNISDTDRSMDKLVNIFYSQALQTLCKEADNSPDNRLHMPTRIFLDDFAANVTIPDFDKLISTIRSREIYVSVILQSLTQLDSMYGEDCAVTIVNNCDHIIYLGCNDLRTAQFLSTRACKTPETIMYMPSDKVYIITRGEKAQLDKKTMPYSTHLEVG